jgi:hypothetical protein
MKRLLVLIALAAVAVVWAAHELEPEPVPPAVPVLVEY